MDRRHFSKLMAAGTAGLGLPGLTARTAAPAYTPPERLPNIVLIMADDLGYNHLGCYGQEKIRTPNLDRMAADGVRFTQAYAGNPLCAASRSCLLTGTHTGHTPVRGNSGGIPLQPEDVTLAEVVKAAGYATGCFGKWGLGEAGTTGIPTRQGFDAFFGSLDQVHAHFYYPAYLWHNEEKYPLPGNADGGREQYSNDLSTEFALAFIRAHRDEPFFCYVPYTIPHTELLVPEDSMAEYRGQFAEEPYVYEGHYAGQTHPRAAFAAMITRMDGYVGRILHLLQELGLEENTLVLFSSDNGGQLDGAGVDLNFFRGNWPLRGAKGMLYEGGIRVPAIARWPGRVQPGTVSNHPWAFWDMLPTFAELAGVTPPAPTDGLSIVPALLGHPAPTHGHLYWEVDYRKVTGPDGVTRPNPGGTLHQAVRMGSWKAIRAAPDAPVELYDLTTDLGEKFNVAGQYPDVVRQAEQLFRTEHVEARPQIEPPSHNDRLYR